MQVSRELETSEICTRWPCGQCGPFRGKRRSAIDGKPWGEKKAAAFGAPRWDEIAEDTERHRETAQHDPPSVFLCVLCGFILKPSDFPPCLEKRARGLVKDGRAAPFRPGLLHSASNTFTMNVLCAPPRSLPP
jgi:hypothetical protein